MPSFPDDIAPIFVINSQSYFGARKQMATIPIIQIEFARKAGAG